MEIIRNEVVIRKLVPSEGMVITDIATQAMRSKCVYLGSEDSSDNYMEIDENTPLPELEEQEVST